MMNTLTKLNIFSKYSNNLKKNLNYEKVLNLHKQFDSKFFNKITHDQTSAPKKISSTFYFSKMQHTGTNNRRLLFKALEKKTQQKQQLSFLFQQFKTMNIVQFQQKQFKNFFMNVTPSSRRLTDNYNRIQVIQQFNQFFKKTSVVAGASMMKFRKQITPQIPYKFKQQFQKLQALSSKFKYPTYLIALMSFFYSQTAFSRDFFDFSLKQDNVFQKLAVIQEVADYLATQNAAQKDKIFAALVNLDAEALSTVITNKVMAQTVAIQFLNSFVPCNRQCKFGPGVEDNKKPLPAVQKKVAADDEESLNTYLQSVIDYFGVGAAFGAGVAAAGSVIAMGFGMTVAAALKIFFAGTALSGVIFGAYSHQNYTKHEKLLQDLCDDYIKNFLNKLEIKRV